MALSIPARDRSGTPYLSVGGKDSYVATILDAPSEKLSFVVSRTIGATSGGIADLPRWELFRSKDLALPRYLRGNGLGLGNNRQQRGGSRQEKSKGPASHSPIIAHPELLTFSPRSPWQSYHSNRKNGDNAAS
jgi:hypothetical protein